VEWSHYNPWGRGKLQEWGEPERKYNAHTRTVGEEWGRREREGEGASRNERVYRTENSVM